MSCFEGSNTDCYDPSDIIFVSSPYTSDDPLVVELRMQALTRYLATLASENKVAFSPLLMHFCLDSGVDLPSDFDFWANFCLNLLYKCDVVHVLKLAGWDKSKGVLTEIAFAEENDIPVVYVDI